MENVPAGYLSDFVVYYDFVILHYDAIGQLGDIRAIWTPIPILIMQKKLWSNRIEPFGDIQIYRL